MFRTVSMEDILKLFMLLNKIIRGQDLYTGPQKFIITRNLIAREALRVFEQNTWDRGTETNENYELVMNDLITNFFPSKAQYFQKRNLQRGLYKPRDTKI